MIYWKRWLKNKNNVDWAKGVQKLSEQEMVDFLFEVSYDDDTISV